MSELKKTPLYEKHLALGAKMVEFGGWLMPLQYTGILKEHQAVRNSAGIFDVSHMGEIKVSGDKALDFLQKLLTNDFGKQAVGQARYTLMCNEYGGIVDDLLVYRIKEKEYWLVVNAGNKDKDFLWIKRQLAQDESKLNIYIKDISEVTGQIALQGPKAEEILAKLTGLKLETIRKYCFANTQVAGIEALVSRTGYTGEDGFEIYLSAANTAKVWDEILAAGRLWGLLPVGLGARDTLRFEAGMPLYGHELSEKITPKEAGLCRFVFLDKGEFIGRSALARQMAEGAARKLVGIKMLERGIPRAGYEIVKDGAGIGVVTSGSFAPSLQENLAMGFVSAKEAYAGNVISVMIRGKGLQAEIIAKPFYKGGRRKW